MAGTPANTDDARLHALFAVPVLVHQWTSVEELNAGLRSAILRRWHASRGIEASNVGGWHSERDLQTWDDPFVAALLERIDALTSELVRRLVPAPEPRHLEGWSLHAWANVSGRGDRNAIHVHHNRPGNLWSGIYYVDDGSDGSTDVGARTVFSDVSGAPREILRQPDPFAGEFTIDPRPGLMVLFPASLPHRVEPYTGDGSRITISWNLGHPGFVIPRYVPPRAPWKAWLWENFRGVMLPLGALKNALRHRWLRPSVRRPPK
jgi:uncharacterized protein (TIGR02466 family)